MKFSKTLFLGMAVLSLTACQTTSGMTSPGDVLLSDLDTPNNAVAGTLLSTSHPTCLKFYENTSTFVSLPMDDISAPAGPSFGDTLMKTVVLGTLAGVASGGVAALGIGSNFVEAAAIGTVSQVTYNVGDSVYDNIVGTGGTDVETPDVPVLTPMQEIEKVAASLGCPAPDQASIVALKSGGVVQ